MNVTFVFYDGCKDEKIKGHFEWPWVTSKLLEHRVNLFSFYRSRADREQMLNNAAGGQPQSTMPVPPAVDDSKINLMEGEQTAPRDTQWGDQYGGGYGGQQQQQGGYGRPGGYWRGNIE